MFKNGMRPAHPGEIFLEDCIKPMGVSVRVVAMALQVPCSRLSEISKGPSGVSADTALRLERYLGSEAKGWLNLQAAYELHPPGAPQPPRPPRALALGVGARRRHHRTAAPYTLCVAAAASSRSRAASKSKSRTAWSMCSRCAG